MARRLLDRQPMLEVSASLDGQPTLDGQPMPELPPVLSRWPGLALEPRPVRPHAARRSAAVLVGLLAFLQIDSGADERSNAIVLAEWVEDFGSDYALIDGDASPDGGWRCAWTGYGTAGTEPADDGLVMKLEPARAMGASSTHSALVLSESTFRDQRIDLDVRTVSQLRSGRPNPWEVGWVLFRAVDPGDFYYFMVKPNGVEMGMLLDGRRQIILATAETAFLEIGRWSHWTITAAGNHFVFEVDGVRALEYTDRSSPAALASGSVGLYTEDAYVQFDNVRVASLSTA